MVQTRATALRGAVALAAMVAALTAVPLMLPATAAAGDGGTSANSGGGATYQTVATTGAISLKVRRGAWVGRATRIRGSAPELAGRMVAIERRTLPRKRWTGVKTVLVADDGSFGVRWKPPSTGRHQVRALAAGATSSDAGDARASSPVRRLTAYTRVRATWYGPGFYGNRTACGQRLTRATLGVAHRTLPCGTRIALRANGRSTVVRVIDRGPFVRGIAYDLTSATADRLGVTGTGRIGAAPLTR